MVSGLREIAEELFALRMDIYREIKNKDTSTYSSISNKHVSYLMMYRNEKIGGNYIEGNRLEKKVEKKELIRLLYRVRKLEVKVRTQLEVENDGIVKVLKRIFKNFHKNLNDLNKKDERDRIRTEHDLQRILFFVLKFYFDDVRREQVSPEYAGGSSRIDFILKKEKVAIETKLASSNLTDRQIGEQLLIDIRKYKKNTNCDKLVCFVYDPNYNINNPEGLKSDLEEESTIEFDIKVFVYPK